MEAVNAPPSANVALPKESLDVSSLNSSETIHQELYRIGASDQKHCENSFESSEQEKSMQDGVSEDDEDTHKEDTPWAEATQQQIALRSHTMEFSHHNLPPANILKLPMDILLQIFSHFKHTDIGYNGERFRWPSAYGKSDPQDEWLFNIRSTRQVCHLFNKLASPLLFPVLSLRLDQESLDRAERILAHPGLASGVLGVQVSLEYRPVELATDIKRFASVKKIKIKDIKRSIDWIREGAWVSDEGEAESSPVDKTSPSYLPAYENADAIMDAWDYYLGIEDEEVLEYLREGRGQESQDEEGENGSDGEDNERALSFEASNYRSEGKEYDPEEQDVKWYRVLWESHREYARRHEEQLRLIRSRAFVNTLSPLACQLRRPIALRIHGDNGRSYNNMTDFEILTDNEMLSKFLISPHTWTELCQIDPTKFEHAKVLSELPIAMHKAGVHIRHLSIGVFPLEHSFPMVCPGEAESPVAPEWDDLGAAFQELETFELAGNVFNGLPIRTRHIPAEEKVYIEKYLNATLSGQRLQQLNLSLRCYGLNDGRSGKRGMCFMAGALANINWPRIKQVSLSYLSVTEEELEQFCRGLGPGIEFLYLYDIDLQNGSWANALDILREKTAAGRKSGKSKVMLADLVGGELGQKTESSDSSDEEYRFLSRPKWRIQNPGLIELFEGYVNGEGVVENPAREKQV